MRKFRAFAITLGLLTAASTAFAQDEERKEEHPAPAEHPNKAAKPAPERSVTRTTVTRQTDVTTLRRNVTATRQFHAGVYRAPPGFVYRRWAFGQSLPAIYFARNYWLDNYIAFGLFAPPAGLVWVRYGPDALLINSNTGEIIQVEYGVFI